MLKKLALAACAFGFSAGLLAAEAPRVLLDTTLGDIEIELNAEKAPISVENFLAYVDSGFYNGVQFHRVIPGFMIQTGGFTADMQQKDTRAPIKNEADNGLHNVRGTLAMARTRDVNSATSQFFINLADNDFLDNGKRDFGYAVFGKVVRGMEVVDQIAGARTGNRGMHQNVPVEPVLIESAKRL
ncbi:peptidylprolyl isomerase [Pseudomonas oryzae]|uniref:Peptidyl-prolyl cis-trans isomerase n=1 Tax=Pseudomonas oryzae TaxID=1392877 RepID=A0A1H1V0K5_9PSED|nr:peptidylprolyl isomerase [Pseudomonas oryzae]SDS78324.1 peptidyl-prolyl cis-trans isomerase A (cyclophilin A) [Pseudomonas oryzae]